MASDLFVVGLSWRTAPVAIRETVAFADDELPRALSDLLAHSAVDEAMLISTCNRVEIYGVTGRSAPASAVEVAAAETRSFLSSSRGVSAERLSANLYEHVRADAVTHVFRVASALDSLVVGEAQILGQLKAAFGVATQLGATGPVLGRCMERAFGVAKRVRSETGISRGAANVSSVAVELARHVFVELTGKVVLVVGAGKMSALAVRHLRGAGAGTIFVTNRSADKAERLAAEVDGVARPWEQLDSMLSIADVVISSTGATAPVLTKPMFKKVMKARRYRSIVIVDIAVPRDADPAIGKQDGVYLFDIDDLQRVVAANLQERAKEAEAAGALIAREVLEFDKWLRSQRVVPTIRTLREHFHEVARYEVERTLQQLTREHSPEQREQAIRRLGQVIVNKLLHAPMTALKSGDDRSVEALVAAANRLFALPSDGTPARVDQDGPPILEQAAGERNRG